MRTIIALVVVGTLAAGTHRMLAAGQSSNGKCADLMSLRLPDLKMSEAVAVPAASSRSDSCGALPRDRRDRRRIRFSLLLPDNWNQKFFMGGGGGFVGSIQNSAQSTVNQGFATAGTDTGHQGNGTDASWAHNNLERQLNFGYLAVHRTAEMSKAIIASYYGKPAVRNYFQGCSRGGGQALMEAQRFPADFDGIISGAPAYDWTGIAAVMIRNMQALFPNPNKIEELMFTPELLKTVEAKILESCDKQDGIGDGVIDDPRQCKVNVDALPLTPAQKNALKVIYAPTVNQNGELYPAQPFGGEGQTAGWPTWITGVKPPPQGRHQACGSRSAPGSPSISSSTTRTGTTAKYNFANWKKDSELAASFLNATNPDLSAYNSRGGKLILWHGWADPALSPLASIRYHEQVYTRDTERGRLLPDVPHARRAALRRRRGSRQRRLDRDDRPVGGAGQGARTRRRDQDAGCDRDAQPAAVPISTEGRLQRIGQHRRREEFFVPEVA